MASTITVYESLSEAVLKGDINLYTDDLYLALVTSSYTPSASAHTDFSDVTGELTTGDGYTAGGVLLTSVDVSSSSGTATLDADDVVWPVLTATFRYGVLYADKSTTHPLIAYILWDDTPADVSVSGLEYKCQWNASGILTLTFV